MCFGPIMQFRIVGDGDGGLIVQIHLDRFVVSESEFSKESGEIDSFFSCFRSGHDFGLARGQGDTGLLLGTPAYDRLREGELPTRSGVSNGLIGVALSPANGLSLLA